MTNNFGTFELIYGNTTINLSDIAEFFHLGNEGLGMAPVERYEQSSPLQNGSTDLGFRLSSRIITLVIALIESNALDYYTKRRAILNIAKPRTSPMRLRITLPDGSVRQLDVFYLQGLDYSSQDKGAFGPYTQKVGIQLKANDPTYYNPESIAVNFGISAASDSFEVPLDVPVYVGSSTLNQTTSISYAGTWETNPIIVVYGPITDFVITNNNTGDKLDFTGATIGNGEIWTIDTRYGYKTIKDANNVSKLASLTDDSDLATFSIVPDEVNSFTVTGTSASQNTNVYLSYFERFIGI